MKTKIYNNLIFSLLFVCSIGGFFGGVLFAQGPIVDLQETNAADAELPDNIGNTDDGNDDEGETAPPTTLNPAQQDIVGKEPLKLHLYSSIFGAGKEIKTSSNDRESVSRTVQGIFGRFFSIIFTLSGILMVILLAVHGTRMIYAEFGGNVAVFSDAKSRVRSAAIGTAILLLSWVILNFIAPSLLRPRLFQTITGLQEVGQSSELYSNNLEIPEGGIKFNESKKELTITRCPEINDANFRNQLDSIKKSLQFGTTPIPLQYSYQILYTKEGSNKVYTYDEGNEEAKFINCKPPNKPDEPEIQLPKDISVIVVFPVVSIGVEESEKVPNTDPPKTRTKIVQKKFWHGLPWKKEFKHKIKDLTKTLLTADSDLFSITFKNSSDTSAKNDLYITISFQSDENVLKEKFKINYNTNSIYIEYLVHGIPGQSVKIVPNNKETEIRNGGECKESVSFFAGSTIFGEDNGSQKILCAKEGSKGFSITPKLSVVRGAGRDANTESYSAEKICFNFARDGDNNITSAEQADC